MTTKPKLGPGTITIDEEKYHTSTFEFEGEVFTVRELSADEGDDIAEAATGPAPEYRFNSRLNTRMLLSKALVDPAVSVERLGKFSGRKHLAILRAFNALNTLPEANPTVPAGSAGQTSPDGGESSPTT